MDTGYVGGCSNGITYVIHGAANFGHAMRVMAKTMEERGWNVLINAHDYKIICTRLDPVTDILEVVTIDISVAPVIYA